MAKARWGAGLVMGCLLLGGAASQALAQQQDAVSQILQYHPTQSGIDFSTPNKAEQARCEAKVITGAQPGSTGYVLLDPDKKTLRRFFDTNGDRQIDVWSYYKDGVEVYREIDSNFNKRPDQFRWFNAGGMKWGYDLNEDGKIDYWKMISADEAAQEAFQAMVAHDFARLKALFITEAELKAMGLPDKMAQQIRSQIENAQAKFNTEVAKLPAFGPKETVVGQVESGSPQCVPGESLGISKDLFRYPTRPIIYQVGKDNKWLNTGEMIQVGYAWRLLDVPTEGPGPGTGGGVDKTPQSNPLLEQLAKIDKAIQQAETTTKPNELSAALAKIYMDRVAVVDQILATAKGSDREDFQHQKADNLSDAAIRSAKDDTRALETLRQFKDQVVAQSPKTSIAAYLTYRLLWTEYTPKLVDPGEAGAKAQKEWLEKLAEFVQNHPDAKDTPEALWQLAMGNEFAGKEDLAKGYYKQLASHFPQNMMAPKAEGAVRRLDLVGKALALNGPTLAGGDFNVVQHRNKVVVVYYWSSNSSSCPADFTKLKRMHDSLNNKGLELVTVNLDDTAKQAAEFLQSHPLAGTHLFAPSKDGGMSSPLATYYGIMGLPTIFLVGKDGNVISRTTPINDLEDAIRKAL
jgi:thiol-disulfide isomerase/thioredoxin